VAERLLTPVAQSLDELLAGVGQDLAQTVVGLDVAELLIGRTLLIGGSRRRLTRRALGPLPGKAGLLEQLALDLGQPLFDV
jgi:hypothetical protein